VVKVVRKTLLLTASKVKLKGSSLSELVRFTLGDEASAPAAADHCVGTRSLCGAILSDWWFGKKCVDAEFDEGDSCVF
jgi:hypothetical protein